MGSSRAAYGGSDLPRRRRKRRCTRGGDLPSTKGELRRGLRTLRGEPAGIRLGKGGPAYPWASTQGGPRRHSDRVGGLWAHHRGLKSSKRNVSVRANPRSGQGDLRPGGGSCTRGAHLTSRRPGPHQAVGRSLPSHRNEAHDPTVHLTDQPRRAQPHERVHPATSRQGGWLHPRSPEGGPASETTRGSPPGSLRGPDAGRRAGHLRVPACEGTDQTSWPTGRLTPATPPGGGSVLPLSPPVGGQEARGRGGPDFPLQTHPPRLFEAFRGLCNVRRALFCVLDGEKSTKIGSHGANCDVDHITTKKR